MLNMSLVTTSESTISDSIQAADAEKASRSVAAQLPSRPNFVGENDLFVHYAAYTPLHEAVHRNVSGGRRGRGWLDEVAGVVCGTILGSSFTLHRAEHFAHHRRTNVTGEDPNKVFGPGVLGVLRGAFAIVPAAIRWYLREVWPSLPMRSRRRVLMETALIVLTRAVPMLAGYAEAVLWFWIVPNLIGNALTAVLFAWIVHEPHDDTSRWGSTAAFDFRGVLKWPVTVLWLWLWLWQNYHAIHHLFPRVPFYRYHTVFHRIDGIMERLGAPVHRFGPGGPSSAEVSAPVVPGSSPNNAGWEGGPARAG